MARKRIFLEVTMTKVYTWEEGEINGWTTDEVIHDWFKRYGLASHTFHATRNAHEIGGCTRFLEAKELSEEEFVQRHKLLEVEVEEAHEQIKPKTADPILGSSSR